MTKWLVLALLSELIAGPALAITLNQVDDFQDGTTQNWSGGSFPTNIANGGPDGTGDSYLQVSASNFHLGARNQVQWAGDYLTEGVEELLFDLNNFGPNAVALRVSVSDGLTTFTTTNETALAAGSGWVSVSFFLTDVELTRTQGTETLDETLAGVTNLLIRHDPDPISPPGEANFVTATLGIDNVTALPEPRTSLTLAVALPVLAALARARRTTSRVIGAGRRRASHPRSAAS
jgi:hypothetical protein